ncbi:hypothetical protein NDU88_005766 [Pleurodeles waltl]|uniref:Myb-like domain-containing protein n=1 Tax=Pleurodeles waltl TaxID=8319 RepID=A0AAV7TVQ4_PLEWA|nr:hypothetical protein NDU88_005766 [Pleurodeles waltl]
MKRFGALSRPGSRGEWSDAEAELVKGLLWAGPLERPETRGPRCLVGTGPQAHLRWGETLTGRPSSGRADKRRAGRLKNQQSAARTGPRR